MKTKIKKLKEAMSDFENPSGVPELDKETFETNIQDMSEETFDEVTEAFYLLAKFYEGNLC